MLLNIHPTHPQSRHISTAAEVIKDGGVIIYPTDSAYALGCQLGDKQAVQRIRRIRSIDKNHFFTLICRDLSEIAKYARVDNWVFRLLKANTPGPYTFLLNASYEVPKLLLHAKRKTIGLRIPDNLIAQSLLEELDEPILSSTLILPDDDVPLTDMDEIERRLSNQVDLIIDGGSCGFDPTTVVKLTDSTPEILRVGKGDPSPFM
ncbi:MAG: L-threonylcarbamoyladenylate synthase [Gammaproteobacteria bacterium]